VTAPKYPHCNTTMLHAPGECFYCDKYPARQAARAASGEEFTPNESNGWSGNVAVKEGEFHSHLGTNYIVGDRTPPRPAFFLKHPRVPVGWWCSYPFRHDGPCPLRPTWWNLRSRWRFRGSR
jgi:hypothetical protein